MKDDGALDSLMLLVSAIVYHIARMECKQSFRGKLRPVQASAEPEESNPS